MLSRRTFIKSCFALAAGAYLGSWKISGLKAAEPSTLSVSDVGPLLSRTIPKSGEQIPIVGLGTFRKFDVGNTAAERKPLKKNIINISLSFRSQPHNNSLKNRKRNPQKNQ